MSPRRKVDAGEPDFFDVPPKPPRRWGLALVAVAATVLIAAALTASTLMLIGHEKDHRTSVKDAAALGYVREFMTAYTTLDPFHANDYMDRILGAGHRRLRKMFKEKENEILIQVAQRGADAGHRRGCGRAALERRRQRRRPGRDEDHQPSRQTGSRRSRAETVGSQRQPRKDSSGRSAS